MVGSDQAFIFLLHVCGRVWNCNYESVLEVR
jgi:hypothetical protein